ncbi:hypothetical protein BGZ73_008561 [Actinomortierella ambigua]|nr:hypothetical protein BGZ73_008561 [Actinomortierella ambigua]
MDLLHRVASVAIAIDAVVSRGFFVGIDPTESGATIEQIFSNPRNHVTATSTLLQFCGANADYVPRHKMPEKVLAAYQQFAEAVVIFPAFLKVDQLAVSVHVSGDLDEFQKAIAQKYKEHDREIVALNLRSAIPTSLHNLYGTHSVLFSLIEISKPQVGDPVRLRVIEMELELHMDAQGNVQLLEQYATLMVHSFLVSSEWLRVKAREFAKLFNKPTTVKQFAQIFTTPNRDEDEDYPFQWVSRRRRLYPFAFDAVISKGLWIGKDRTKAGASLEQIFSDPRNHVTATSSLLQFFGADNDYIPRDLTPVKGRYNYEEFKFSVNDFPAFVRVEKIDALVYVSGNLDEFQKAIVEEYKGKDNKLVALNLRSSIPTKSHSLHGAQSVLFSLVEILKPQDDEPVTVKIFEMKLDLFTNERGVVRLQEQDATLAVYTFHVDSEYLQERSQELAEDVAKITTVKEFAQIFTTPDEDEDNQFPFQWAPGRRRVYRNLPAAC